MLRFLSFLWIGLCLATAQCFAYSGGTGEPNNPYQIATPQDLIDLGNEPNDYDKCFILTADIDLSGYTFDRAVIAPDEDGDSSFDGTEFLGSFDGQGHVVSHLSIQGAYYLGLFGKCSSGAIISNLGLEAVDVNGTGNSVGGLVGDNDGIIMSSYSTGSVSGDRYVGGLVGYNYGGSITSSYSTGSVSGTGNSVGGLVGDNDGIIMSSYSTGSVSGDRYVGGLVGVNYFGIIMSSYSTGSVSGTENSVGGLVGHNYGGSITSSYSTGSVSGAGNHVGGLMGFNYHGSITSSFWDTETSGWSGSDGGVGLTTTEMMDAQILGLDGLANDPNWVLDPGLDYPHLAWEGTVGESIPEPIIDWIEGSGTQTDPYRIETLNQLQLISKAGGLMDRCFELSNDFDLSGLTWPQAVIPYFNGRFDGNHHVISHLTIDGQRHLGFFGRLGSNAEVLNLGLEAVDVNGTGDYVGGLVGRNDSYYGSITSSYSTGSVSGTGDYVGGLVGYNYSVIITSSYSTGSFSGNDRVGGLVGYNYSGIIMSSYSTGSIIGTGDYVGGLVGRSDGSITSSYGTGSISGNDRVGGLVGYNGGSITSSYSTGSVSGILDGVGGLVGVNGGSITSSFWDNQTSGQTESAGGTGLTTTQMHSIETYINAGWDWVGETTHGTCNYWVIQEGHYPSLAVFSGFLPVELNGSGSLDDPYLLTDVNELGSVWSRPGACYRLEADIDLNDIVWNSAVVPGFGGVFDGNEHVISSLRINGGGCLGLFGICTSNATIFNLGLESVDVSGTGYFVGGLVGVNGGSITSSYSIGSVSGILDGVGGLVGDNDGSITSSYSTGLVSGDDDVGGLVGDNSGSITSSYSTGSVSGDDDVGGLVGVNGGRFVGGNDGIIMSSYSTGSVTGDYDVGGLVGNNYNGPITSSYSTGSVSGISSDMCHIGGLVGINDSSITSSYSTGSVTGIGEGAGGGLVGWNYYGSITSSYSTGSVTGDYYSDCVGGLVGNNEKGSITSSYSTGSVSGIGEGAGGGLVGWNCSYYYGSITSSFWDTETSGQSTSDGGTGLTTVQMQDINIFLDEGWDFVDETANGTDDIWWMPVGDYPRLWWEE